MKKTLKKAIIKMFELETKYIRSKTSYELKLKNLK